MFCVFGWLAPAVCAANQPLDVSTETRVGEKGTVDISLTLKNSGSQPLFHLHPMFHFHHTRSMMPRIDRLDPGESVTLENPDHPPVVRVGRYPLVAMVSYREDPRSSVTLTRMHTDSFYYREPVVSQIVGEMESSVEAGESFLRVFLRNDSPSFKNIRLMLLLPPGLMAEGFKGMMGLTIRGGEGKYFEVPVRRVSGSREGTYPVHLMIEYGEMLKHYTGEIRGKIQYGAVWNPNTMVVHLLAMALFGWMLFWWYRENWRRISPF